MRRACAYEQPLGLIPLEQTYGAGTGDARQSSGSARQPPSMTLVRGACCDHIAKPRGLAVPAAGVLGMRI